jgi:hypothetical protein
MAEGVRGMKARCRLIGLTIGLSSVFRLLWIRLAYGAHSTRVYSLRSLNKSFTVSNPITAYLLECLHVQVRLVCFLLYTAAAA